MNGTLFTVVQNLRGSYRPSDGDDCVRFDLQILLSIEMGKKRTFDEGEGEEEVQVAEEVAVPAESAGKSKKTKKPLPPGYVCKACGMKDDHAIYDCTLAVKKSKQEKEAAKSEPAEKPAPVATKSVTKPAAPAEVKTNNEASNSAPSSSEATPTDNSLTAFITGLPFKTNRTKVIEIFQSEGFAKDVTGKDVKLVMFEDRPEKCRGLAYVTFKSTEDYNKAIALSGKEYEGRSLQIVPCAPMVTKTGDAPGAGTGGKSNIKGAFKSKGKQLPEGVVKIPRCYRCGALHDAKTCTNQRICYKCKGTDHLSSQCPLKKKPAASSE